MRFASIRNMDVSNGEGVGIALFVQGCHFHCKGCFNAETWDFNGGHLWTKEIEDNFIKLADKPYISRISILGGEPLADENEFFVYNLMQRLKTTYPNKKIWLYTGYKWENVCKDKDSMKFKALTSADVVVDGQFDITKQDLYNEYTVWAGSYNQRVIDVAKAKENDYNI